MDLRLHILASLILIDSYPLISSYHFHFNILISTTLTYFCFFFSCIRLTLKHDQLCNYDIYVFNYDIYVYPISNVMNNVINLLLPNNKYKIYKAFNFRNLAAYFYTCGFSIGMTKVIHCVFCSSSSQPKNFSFWHLSLFLKHRVIPFKFSSINLIAYTKDIPNMTSKFIHSQGENDKLDSFRELGGRFDNLNSSDNFVVHIYYHINVASRYSGCYLAAIFQS